MKVDSQRLLWLGLGLVSTIAIARQIHTSSVIATPAPTQEIAPVSAPTAFNLPKDRQPFVPTALRQSDNPFPYRAVIRGDDRVPMMSREFPWAAIGRLDGINFENEGYSCTGTLIAEAIVLTNAHCVINPETGKPSRKIAFQPNMVDGSVPDTTDVAQVETYHAGTNFRDGKENSDWALLKIDKPLGKKYGYLGWKNLPSTQLIKKPKQMALIGYSADFPKSPKSIPGLVLKAGPGMTAGVHRGCSVLKKQEDLLLHDCDTTGGASGGPILSKFGDKYYIVAIHAGWRRVEPQKILNYAVEIARIEEWIEANAE